MADDNRGDPFICNSDEPGKGLDQRALDECVEEFVRGVHSFHGNRFHSDLTISNEVVDRIKKTFKDAFTKHLADEAEEKPDWRKSGKRVRRIAFHAGSLAACYVHRDTGRPKKVDFRRAFEAITHVSKYCREPDRGKGEVQAEWIFCPWHNEDTTEGANGPAQQGHEDG